MAAGCPSAASATKADDAMPKHARQPPSHRPNPLRGAAKHNAALLLSRLSAAAAAALSAVTPKPPTSVPPATAERHLAARATSAARRGSDTAATRPRAPQR
eukprot:TRINITY_DN7353_c0_g2_i1.p2 TRINITY_DN7353_c0_g2~~TRINITY_DN7353_c0_g2_i1.p2  ORF type:complete len:101 (+),score=18.02 TRINITY_DN7353_c0_g2_i1:105-407(+)